MLKRKFYDYLLNWRKTKNQECLFVKGARQVGKTFIIDYFGKTNYKSYIYINFLEHPEYKIIFSYSLDAATLYQQISLNINNVTFIPGNTLIFLDEIQECPNARTALKFLALDNQYDVIASGSLLGTNYKADISSIPVGYERQVDMYSLDFEEFCWASGKSVEATKIIKSHFDTNSGFDKLTNSTYSDLFRLFIIVGGMPEVVNSFFKDRNLASVHSLQQKIIRDYLNDIDKYAPSAPLKQKIKDAFNSIPNQLVKPYNNRFQYSLVSPNGKKDKYWDAINWLIDAGIASPCFNISIPETPLIAYKKEFEFKIYLNDTGLLTAMFGFNTQRDIYNQTLKGSAKGGIYENVIAETLTKNGFPLYYYKHSNSQQEIEFVIENDDGVVPIEVKPNANTSISLSRFIEEFKPNVAYKLVDTGFTISDKKKVIPLYMSFCIKNVFSL
ncbi:MAG: AAA family ATPase [Coprobacillus sp.]|nr:AAA family ATPase [Coprobacillus sp.]